jgi:hypothetical protein
MTQEEYKGSMLKEDEDNYGLSADSLDLLNHIRSSEYPQHPVAPNHELKAQCIALDQNPPAEAIKLYMKSVEQIASRNKSNIPADALYKSLFKERAAVSLQENIGQFAMWPPTEQIRIYPIKMFTYNDMIQIPVRGSNCTHQDVMDLEYLIREVRNKGWFCPICGRKIGLDSIYIDKELQAEIKRIYEKGLPKPDLLICAKNKKNYVHVNCDRLIEDFNNSKIEHLGITDDYNGNIIKPGLSYINLFLTPRLSSDKKFFEVPVHEIPVTDFVFGSKIIFYPVVIFANALSTLQFLNIINQIALPSEGNNPPQGFDPMSEGIKKTKIVFVTIPVCFLDCNSEELRLLMKLAFGMGNPGIKPLIYSPLGYGGEMKLCWESHVFPANARFYRIMSENHVISESGPKYTEFIEEKLKSDVEKKAISVDTRNVSENDCKAADDTTMKLFQATVSTACSNICTDLGMAKSDNKEVEAMTFASGTVLQIPASFCAGAVTKMQPNTVIEICKKTGLGEEEAVNEPSGIHNKSNTYKIRVPHEIKALLYKEKNILVFWPKIKDAPQLKGMINISYKGALEKTGLMWPMLLSDCIAYKLENLVTGLGEIRELIATKSENPYLMRKQMLIYYEDFEKADSIETNLKGLINNRDLKPVLNLPATNTKGTKKIFYDWLLNLWIIQIDSNIKPIEFEMFFYDYYLQTMTIGISSVVPFYAKGHETLSAALEQRLISAKGKNVAFAKGQATISGKTYILDIH